MPDKKRRRRLIWIALAVATVLGGLAAAWRFTPLADFATAQNVKAWAESVRSTSWAPFAVIAAYTPAAFVMFPRPLLTLFSVVAFGTWLGFGYATVGILIAATATYYAGRVVKRDTLRRWGGDALERASEPLRRHGVLAIFASNLLPTPPFVIQGMIAGAIRIKLWEYLAGSVLGLLPGIVAWSIFGSQITAAIEGEGGVSWWVIGGTVVAMIAFAWLGRRWAQQGQDKHAKR